MLLVESNETDVASFRSAWTLASLPNALEVVPTGEDALAVLENRRPSHIFIDLDLPGIGGAELVAAIRASHSQGIIVLMCREMPQSLIQVRITKYECAIIRKPPAVAELKAIMARGW